MPTSDHDALDRIRELFLAAIADRDAAQARQDRIMSHLQDLIENGKRLAAERVELIADRDSERARADAAEKRADDLQARVDADDETARAAKEALDAEIAKGAGLGAKAEAGPAEAKRDGANSGDAQPDDRGAAGKPEPVTGGADVQKDGVVVTTSPTGATVTVDAAAGTTTHTDAAGFTTTLDHATGAATARDADGAPVEPHEDAVAEASIATAIAGVTVQHAA